LFYRLNYGAKNLAARAIFYAKPTASAKTARDNLQLRENRAKTTRQSIAIAVRERAE
jgi:hypothetical protein